MHFKIWEPRPFSPFWFSHKFKRAGLTYEIGLNVHTADICWAYGGFPAAVSDLTMAKRGVLSVLPIGEMIIADKGYIGEPNRIITPIEDYSTNFNYQHKLMMARHEGVNKRVKDWHCMSATWRHGWESHIRTFYAVIALTQIKLENGEPLPKPFIY